MTNIILKILGRAIVVVTSLVPPLFANIFVRIILKRDIDYLKRKLKSCGKNVTLFPYVIIHNPDKVSIGDDTSIAEFVHIWGGGGVQIGKRVMIATHTAITSLTHNYNVNPMNKTLIAEPVIIDDDVWIGSNVTICPGVTIGQGAVIGAGAVVLKDIPDFAIAMGVPANVIKMRDLR